MIKFVFFLLLVSITNIVSAQSVTDYKCTEVRVKLKQYYKDSITMEIEKILDLFEKGDVFDQSIINKKYLGVAYILSDDNDCLYESCNNPAISAAVWFGTDTGICMMGIRKTNNSEPKRPLSNYVKAYLNRNSVSNEVVTKYIVMTRFNSHLSSYDKQDKSFVINNNENNCYIRKNGDYIIGLSVSDDGYNSMIYVFDIAGQEKFLSFGSAEKNTTSQPTQYSAKTKEKIEELRAIERDRNEFSEMIETIVNNKDLSSYYHNREMFIFSSGMFRDNLEIKYNGKDMLIIAMPLEGVTDYIEFTRCTYNGETDNPVSFEFRIKKEGCFGNATFKYINDKWTLESINIFEN